MNTRIRGGGQASESRLPLSEPRLLVERAFRRGDVPAVRRFTRSFGGRSGMASARLADFVLAVSEASACATASGPCTARVRLWIADRRAFCEVNGDGLLIRRVTARPDGRTRRRRCAAWCCSGSPITSRWRSARAVSGSCSRCRSPDATAQAGRWPVASGSEASAAVTLG